MKNLSQFSKIFLNLLVLPLGITAFNIFLFYPWFLGSAPANLGSIEVSYVSMAKFLVSNWPHLSWAPFWYLGFPFHVFYTPILPVSIALLHVFGNVDFWQAYRIFTGLGLVLAPVSLFFMVLTLSKDRMAALASAVFYSIAPSIFYFILSSGEVKADNFGSPLLDPRRIVNLARWGEGPHIFSLIFLPLAGLFFFKALNDRRKTSVLSAVFFIALTALTNAIGLYALAVLLFSIFVVELFFEAKDRFEVLARSIFIAVFTYGLLAFWYNLSFMKTFFGEGGGVVQNWLNMMPWGIAFLLGGLFLLLFIFKKTINDKASSAVFLWAICVFTIVAVYYLSAPPEVWQERVELAPQALRYVLEVDMAIAALVGILIALLAKKTSVKNQIAGRGIGLFFSLAVLAFSLGYGFIYAPSSWKILGNQIDLEQSAEKKMADFFAQSVDSGKGERIVSAANYAFYLNYFTDIWQLRGALYQAKTHPWPEHIYYQLRIGKDPEIVQAWLEAINAKYIAVVPGGEYEEKEKFKMLPLLATLEDGSLIYEVPIVNSSPVKIVNLSPMEDLQIPKKGDDKEPIMAYASWIKEIPDQTAGFQKINNDLYKIKANLRSGEGLLVQITSDGGWRAQSPGGKIAIKKDPLGFFVLIPSRAGEWEITLTHGKTTDVWLGYLITLITFVLAVVFLFKREKTAPGNLKNGAG